jgi:NAD(P)H-dependent FMN reductase
VSQQVGVIIGSTRPSRICPAITDWALAHLAASSDLSYQVIDLATVDLPFLDEPRKPALGHYAQEHTRRWSARVSAFDAFVFVFPQYNWGYPAVLKNALDFLYEEWHDKPGGLVTYGTRGGGKAAAQLRSVLQGLHMRPLDRNVELRITDDDVDERGQLLDLPATLAPFGPDVRALAADLAEALLDNQAV